jgi:hypothetical protein
MERRWGADSFVTICCFLIGAALASIALAMDGLLIRAWAYYRRDFVTLCLTAGFIPLVIYLANRESVLEQVSALRARLFGKR